MMGGIVVAENTGSDEVEMWREVGGNIFKAQDEAKNGGGSFSCNVLLIDINI